MHSKFFQKTVFLLTFLSNSILAQQKPLFEVTIGKDGDSQSTLEEVRKLILDHYYYDGITSSDLDWASIEGILRHISPPESPELATLWTDEEYEKILNSLKGVKVTMGFKSNFNASDGSLTVTAIDKNSAAEEKLKINDRILRIDKESLIGKSIDEINALLDGDVGQRSTLKVIRDITVFDVELIRDSVKTENVIVTKVPNRDAALIELKQFSLGVSEEVRLVINNLKAEGIDKLILDLRNNSGGVLNEGVNVARLFMKKNDIVLRTQSRSNGITNYISDMDQFYDEQIIVLINENTASSAEIVAGALQDHGRATLVGKKTFGKGVIETTYTLSNNYRLKFITNAMYSPKGKSWQKTGILPDYFVDQTPANLSLVINMEINERLRNDLHLSTALKLIE